MEVRKGNIYSIKESVFKYRFCCDYIQVLAISPKTFLVHPCYEKDKFIYSKNTTVNKRVPKEVFYKEIKEGKIKLI